MEIDRWIGSYKIRSIPWIDGKRIYFNVQYYASGQSAAKPPIWDKTVYITDDKAGRRLVYDFTDSLINHIAGMQLVENTEVTLDVIQKNIQQKEVYHGTKNKNAASKVQQQII